MASFLDLVRQGKINNSSSNNNLNSAAQNVTKAVNNVQKSIAKANQPQAKKSNTTQSKPSAMQTLALSTGDVNYTPNLAIPQADKIVQKQDQLIRKANDPAQSIYDKVMAAKKLNNENQKLQKLLNKDPIMNAISDTNLEFLGGMTTGFGNILKSGSTLAQGIGGLTGNQNLVRNAQRYANDLGMDQAMQNVRDQSLYRQSDNAVLNTLGDVFAGVGNMVPMLTVGNLTGSNALGLGTMATGVFGGKGDEAMNNLSADGELSRTDALRGLGYGAGNAAVEVLTENLNKVLPWEIGRGGNFLQDIAGEAGEEMLSAAVDPFLDPLANNDVQNAQQYFDDAMNHSFGDVLTLGPNFRQYADNILREGVTGALTSAVLGGTNAMIDNANSPINTRQNIEATPVVEQTPHTLNMEETQPSAEATIADTTGMTTEPITLEQAFDNIQPVEVALDNASETSENWQADPIRTEINNARQNYEAYGADYRNYTGESWSDAMLQRAIDKANATKMARTQTGDATTQPAQTAQELFEQETQNIPEGVREQVVAEAEKEIKSKLNRTYDRVRNGENVGPIEFSDDTVESVKGRVDAMDDSTRYVPFSKGEALESAAYKIATEGPDSMFAKVQNFDTTPKSGLAGVLNKISNYIHTDYSTLQTITDAEALTQYYETEIKRLYEEANKLGTIVKEQTKDGVKYKLMNGETEVESDIPKQLQEITAKRDMTFDKLIPLFHDAGTQLNMAMSLKKISPSYQLQSIQKGLDTVNAEARRVFRKEFKTGEMQDIKIPAELEEAFLTADTQEQRNEIKQQIADYAASQLGHTKGEKLRSYRYIMMLFNPATIVRNDVGNVMMRGMAMNKDIVRYGTEAVLKKLGFVRRNNLDLGRKADKALFNYANTAIDTLGQDVADARTTGNTRQALEGMGYNGALGRTMNRYVGEEFSLNNEPEMRQRTVTEFANVAKENGWKNDNGTLVDAEGNPVSQETIRQTINESYNTTRRQFLAASDLQQVNVADGEYGRAGVSKEAKQTATQIYEMLKEELDDKMLSKATISDSDFVRAVRNSSQNRVFDDSKLAGKLLNQASDVIGKFMNEEKFWGDAKFVKDNYVSYMARALSAQGLTATIDGDNITLTKDGQQLSKQQTNNIIGEIHAKAMQEALVNTYRDMNNVADALNSISRSGKIAGFIVDATIPFTRTPMNILRRAVEYSPAGLVNSLGKLYQVQQGNLSGEEFLQTFAKGTTGTGALLLGMLLKNLGVLRGKSPNKDEDEKAFEEANGIKDYQLILPNGDSISVDWAAPSITPFLLGAQVQEMLDSYQTADGQDASEALWKGGLLNSLGTMIEPIMDTTYMSGLRESLASYGSDEPGSMAMTMVQTYMNQLTPTLGAKLGNIFDEDKMSTASDTVADRMLRNVVSRLRFLDWMYAAIDEKGERYLKPQLDINGEPIPNEDNGMGMFGRALNNLVFPWTYNRNTMDDVDRELERLHQTTDQSAVLPEQQYYYSGRKFTAKERDEYNRYFLGNFRDSVSEFMASPQYQNMDDEERATVIRSMSSHFKAKATAQFLSMAGEEKKLLTERDAAVDEAEKLGISVPEFYTLVNTQSVQDGNGDSIPNSKAITIRAALEANGTWDDVYNAWKNGTFDPTKLGLNKTVLKWDDADFTSNYMQLLDGRLKAASESATAKREAKEAKAKADGSYYTSSKKSSGSSRKSSGSSSRRSSGSSSRTASTSGSSSASAPTSLTPDQALAAAMEPTSAGKIETSLNSNYGVDSSLQSLYDSIMRNHTKRLNNLKGNL